MFWKTHPGHENMEGSLSDEFALADTKTFNYENVLEVEPIKASQSEVELRRGL